MGGRKLLGLKWSLEYHQRKSHETWYTFEDNCQRMAKADLIIMVHGAGLSNLICAHPDARVIEINQLKLTPSMYWYLARQMGLSYCFAAGIEKERAEMPPDKESLQCCLR